MSSAFRTVPRTLFGTSEAGSMLCGTALVLGAAVATVTVDKFGRKVSTFYLDNDFVIDNVRTERFNCLYLFSFQT